MAKVGIGYCDAGFYAGWDDASTFTIDNKEYSGKPSYEACKALCLSESQCTYASSIPGLTCSRYSGVACKFTETNGAKFFDHVTFKKEIAGKFTRSNLCDYVH